MKLITLLSLILFINKILASESEKIANDSGIATSNSTLNDESEIITNNTTLVDESEMVANNSTLVDELNTNTNSTLLSKSRIFCRYNNQGMSEVYNPSYGDEDGNLIFPQTIEEYAKALGPTWYGVSWCNNSTMVNSIGLYFDISDVLKKLKKQSNKTIIKRAVIDNDSDINDRSANNILLRDKDNIEEYKKNADKYIEEIYNELRRTEKKCIPLVSVNPAFNPYHKSLTVDVGDSSNIRSAFGSYINFSDSVMKSVIDYNNLNINNDISNNFSQCVGVSNCKGCTIFCNTLISVSMEYQYSVTTSSGTSTTRSIGDTTSNSNTLTDEIAN
ncbi:hypothetical protein BCR32DRAFT_277804 [Anaeromyces robustus]|uniref:Uncharacterized protein n=1 Tax=Anaeromyces robustus TaxID=1754192 RepID=A0A1Y1XDB4_9FUNG|nr:hypothetical protein BCR32DRAFT_277804 [Anaeromyces robustus]|eukprot:ORX83723.1 hypothetical protein BCR32DRAFT_277804 [Anaeromyces robustus]